MRRIVKQGLGIVGAAAVVGGLVAGFGRFGAAANDPDPDTKAAQPSATATVERRDLAEQEELSGTLGYGDTTDVSVTAGGTITALPALGTVIDRGGTLLSIDGIPLELWLGSTPLWRQLDALSTDGIDILEIEENLVALGYATADELTVDEDWTSATTAAVKAWQDARGLDETGVFAPTDVVMLAGAVRVADYLATPGAKANGPVLAVTGSTQVVSVDLEATKQSLVHGGDAVEVVVPDGSVLPGVVFAVGTVAQTAVDSDPLNPSEPTIEMTIALTDAAAVDLALDQAPVTVRVTTSAAEDVLAVPVDALLALSGGGFAVEKVGSTRTELVAVDPGAFADGWVEVTGEVVEGDEVVVPA